MAFLFIYLSLICLSLAFFLTFHIFLILTNHTTNEVCKRKTVSNTCDLKQSEKRRHQKSKVRHLLVKESEEDKIRKNSFMFSVYNRGIFNNILEVLSAWLFGIYVFENAIDSLNFFALRIPFLDSDGELSSFH